MAKQNLKFTKVKDVKSPTRGTKLSAGIDFYVPTNVDKIELQPGQSTLIPSGIKVNVPKGHSLIAFNKSGIATKRNLQVGACVVDEDYQGEVHIHLTNVGSSMSEINGGDKIVQFILIPVYYADIEEVKTETELFENVLSERKSGGFGHTGDK